MKQFFQISTIVAAMVVSVGVTAFAQADVPTQIDTAKVQSKTADAQTTEQTAMSKEDKSQSAEQAAAPSAGESASAQTPISPDQAKK